MRIDKAGNQTILVDEKASMSLALKSVKTRRVVDKNGAEATIVDMESRDFLPYVHELNAIDQGSKHQVTGGINRLCVPSGYSSRTTETGLRVEAGA